MRRQAEDPRLRRQLRMDLKFIAGLFAGLRSTDERRNCTNHNELHCLPPL